LLQHTRTQSSFDQSEPSVVPSQQLFRTQAIIETLLGSKKSGDHQNSLHISVAEAGSIRLRLIRQYDNRVNGTPSQKEIAGVVPMRCCFDC